MSAMRTGTAGQEGHLSDEQFAELVLGADGGATPHLAQCAGCSAEVERFGGAVREFRGAVEGWSESRSPLSWQQQMRRSAGAPVSKARRRLVAASCAMAAGAVLAVGASTWTHRQGAETDAAVSAGGATVSRDAMGDADRASEIAEDNRWMRDVSLALRRDDASAVRAYGLVEARGQSRPRMETRSQ